jgi:signal transduction histidine kinase
LSGLDQLQYLSWLLYLFVFVAVLVRTIRRPTPAHLDMTLFFGAVAILIAVTTLTSRLNLAQPEWVVNLATLIAGAAAMSLGYLLLRLVHDFTEVPGWLMRAVEIGLLAAIAAIVLLPSPLPVITSLLLVAYLVVVLGYDTWAFAQQVSRTRGVTRRRMQAVAAGSLSLALALLVAGLGVGAPRWAGLWGELGAALGLASGAFYFIGFAPPTWLRRAWQEPEIRSFLARAASLTRLPDTRAVIHELEHASADALGASGASISLWDPDTRRLNSNPEHAALFEAHHARTILSAPITTSEKRLGVLVVYAQRAPVFANSDMELVQLLADQAAVILENRALISEAASVAAREEAARLKEDFLSSAAHDLKTPLTGLVTQAQILQRKAQRSPNAPADAAGIDRLLQQSLRLKDLVLELLDVSRLEQGGLVGALEDVDLGALVRNTVEREPAWKRVGVIVDEPVAAAIDTLRLGQVLTNLVENALKYSPHPTPVHVRVWTEDGEARLSVQDQGIGIPVADQPLVFERFHRASNVDDRRFAGMGLGLYIARGIVQQHGGRIWLDSAPGAGSTFFVALPVTNVDGTSATHEREHQPETRVQPASA